MTTKQGFGQFTHVLTEVVRVAGRSVRVAISLFNPPQKKGHSKEACSQFLARRPFLLAPTVTFNTNKSC